ncbi:MAG: esterase [Moraxellaceae bacterium]|nr:esterase [Moraxellaceae bacterium]
MTDLIYIHGFNSSPQSAKAQQLLIWAAQHRPDLRLHIPALPVDPEKALALLEASVQACGSTPGLIGSSLGGFYANVLAARHGLRAVLINPAVHPHRLLAQHLGSMNNYHTGEVSELRHEHIDVLEQLEVSPLYPEHLWVLLETGDETLDYQQAATFYAACHVNIAVGGSHSYEGFEAKLPAIMEFLNQQVVAT